MLTAKACMIIVHCVITPANHGEDIITLYIKHPVAQRNSLLTPLSHGKEPLIQLQQNICLFKVLPHRLEF